MKGEIDFKVILIEIRFRLGSRTDLVADVGGETGHKYSN